MKTIKNKKMLLGVSAMAVAMVFSSSPASAGFLPDADGVKFDVGVSGQVSYTRTDDDKKDGAKKDKTNDLHLRNQRLQVLTRVTFDQIQIALGLDLSNCVGGEKADDFLRKADAPQVAAVENICEFKKILETATITWDTESGAAFIFGSGNLPKGLDVASDKYGNESGSYLFDNFSGRNDRENVWQIAVKLDKKLLNGVLDSAEFSVFNGDSGHDPTANYKTSSGYKSFAFRMNKKFLDNALKVSLSYTHYQDQELAAIVKALAVEKKKDNEISLGFVYKIPGERNWRIYGEYIRYSGDRRFATDVEKTTENEDGTTTHELVRTAVEAENEFTAILGTAAKWGPGILTIEAEIRKELANGATAKGETAQQTLLSVSYSYPVNKAIEIGAQITACVDDGDVKETCADWKALIGLKYNFGLATVATEDSVESSAKH